MAPSANLHLQGKHLSIPDSTPHPLSDPSPYPADDPFTDDSDTEPDSPAAAHYLPITADSDSDDNDVITPFHLNGSIASHPNPSSPHIENGVAELHLDGSEGVEEEVEVVEREEEVMARAFTEDESRRSAPLAPEAAARIVDAMRGVSFQGVPPVWLEEVPEERWVDQLRRLRESAQPNPDAGATAAPGVDMEDDTKKALQATELHQPQEPERVQSPHTIQPTIVTTTSSGTMVKFDGPMSANSVFSFNIASPPD